MAEIKIGGKTRFENLLLKQLFHSALVGYKVISLTNSRVVGYFITSYPTRDACESTRRIVKWCTREVAKHERSVRVARGDSRVRL